MDDEARAEAEAVIFGLGCRVRFERTADRRWCAILIARSMDPLSRAVELSAEARTQDVAIAFLKRKMRESGYSDFEISSALGAPDA